MFPSVMLPASYNPRGEEKLKLILGQLTALRSRLNGLAFQQGLFIGLALLVSTAAIVVLMAYVLPALAFLTIGTAVTLACLAGLTLAIRHAWRMYQSAEAVAALADRRAELKGRLQTLVALQKQTARSPLWPYLVEDATLRREEFAPARIERRRVSRTLYALLAALIVAGLVAPVTSRARRPVALAKRGQGPLTLNLRDLNIQPSDGSVQNGGRLSGDPRTMRKLAQMLAEAQRKEQHKDLLSKMMRSAHKLAGSLQDKITGQKTPPLDIRLADNGGSGSNPTPPPAEPKHNPSTSNGQSAATGSPQSGAQVPDQGADRTPPGEKSNGLAMRPAPGTPTESQPSSGTDTRPFADQQRSGNDAGGASHGAGTDPEGLYGPPDKQAKAESSFQIAIDARAGSAGHASDRAYPPKVIAPLNTDQHPDEPIGRIAVPASDRNTIKRIFER